MSRRAVAVPFAVYLRLGRVSNLPTVWTNVLAGVVLSGGEATAPVVLALLLALSLFYVGGMYLNDAFDREIDARERPGRPIPAGLITARRVFTIGFALLGAGLAGVAVAAAVSPAGGAWTAVVAGLVLGGAIVAYDARHTHDPLSPLVMAVCRVLVYVTAALAVSGRLSPALGAGSLALLAYLIGLTYVARQETLAEMTSLWPLLFLAVPFLVTLPALGAGGVTPLLHLGFLAWVGYALALLGRRRPGNIPRAVVCLIAGISLLDALLIAHAGAPHLAGWAVAGFALTLTAQRYIAGT